MELAFYQLLQCFQALVHSQSIRQCRPTRFSDSSMFKTVEESTPELVQVVLVTIVHYVVVACLSDCSIHYKLVLCSVYLNTIIEEHVE